MQLAQLKPNEEPAKTQKHTFKRDSLATAPRWAGPLAFAFAWSGVAQGEVRSRVKRSTKTKGIPGSRLDVCAHADISGSRKTIRGARPS